MDDFRAAILSLIKSNVPMTLIVGTVSELDKDQDVCIVTPDDAPAHFDVKLRSIIDEDSDSKIVVYPKEGSKVIIGLIDNDPNNTAVISISEFESILITLQTLFKLELKSDGSLNISTDNIIVNNGVNGGLVKSAIAAAQVNEIKRSINTLKGLISSWVPVPTDGGAALKALLTSWSASTLASVSENDFENEKFKH